MDIGREEVLACKQQRQTPGTPRPAILYTAMPSDCSRNILGRGRGGKSRRTQDQPIGERYKSCHEPHLSIWQWVRSGQRFVELRKLSYSISQTLSIAFPATFSCIISVVRHLRLNTIVRALPPAKARLHFQQPGWLLDCQYEY